MRRALHALPDAAGTGVDWTNPLSRGLVWGTHSQNDTAWNGDAEVVSGIPMLESGLIHLWPSVEGPARRRQDATSPYIYKWYPRHNLGTGDITVAVRLSALTDVTSALVMASNGSAGLGWVLYQNRNATGASANAGCFLTYDATNGIYACGAENVIVDGHFKWYIGIRRQTALELWRDGLMVASAVAATARNVNATGTQPPQMGYGTINSRGRHRSALLWNRALMPDEIITLVERPDALFASSVRRQQFYVVPSTTNATGTLSATDGADSAAFAGAQEFIGALAATDGADQAAFSGSHVISVSGSFSATDGADAAAFDGIHTINVTGTLAATDGADAASFAGSVAADVSGSFAATDGADLATFAGLYVSSSIWTPVAAASTTWTNA